MNIRFTKAKKVASSGKFYLLAILITVTSVFTGLQNTPTASAAIGSVTEYTAPRAGTVISGIGVGPDGNVWFTSSGPATATSVGKVTSSGTFTEYLGRTPNSKTPKSITTGSDGNVWYAEMGNNNQSRIIKLSSSGVVLNTYVIGSNYRAEDMVLGPDGDLWFIYNYSIGRIDTSGVTTFYTNPYGVGRILDITPGPDGNIWYASGSISSSTKNSVGKMTPSGTFTNYPFVSTYVGYFANDLVTGSDGNLWAPMEHRSSFLKLTTSGVMTEYPVGSGSLPIKVAAASDGNVWYVGSSRVGKITPSGSFTKYAVPGINPYNGTKNITSGTDGAVWVTDTQEYSKIRRIAVELTSQTVTFTSTAPSSAVIDGQTYMPVASASSGLPVAITIDSSSSAVCSIDGSGVVSFQGVGTCTINADQAGDADYKPAPQVQQSFGVLPVNADS